MVYLNTVTNFPLKIYPLLYTTGNEKLFVYEKIIIIRAISRHYRNYDNNDKTYMEDTFDFIKAIKWHWDLTEH